MRERPTPAQLRELVYAARCGGLASYPPSNNGLAANAWHRTWKRICDRGWAKPYVHGGYEITDDGRNAITAGNPDKEASK